MKHVPFSDSDHAHPVAAHPVCSRCPNDWIWLVRNICAAQDEEAIVVPYDAGMVMPSYKPRRWMPCVALQARGQGCMGFFDQTPFLAFRRK